MEKNLKYIEKIDTFENESIYIKKCFTAVRSIAANPQLIMDINSSNKTILERNYILSMVYSMGKMDCLQEDIQFIFGSSSYFVGGETNKYISLKENKVKKTCKELHFNINDGRIEVIPDLVLHNSHNPEAVKKGNGQYLALEAKTAKRLGQYYFNRDFFKLNLYLAGLHFQNAVFLVINKSAKTIDKYIAAYVKNNYYCYDHLDIKLRLFIQESNLPEMYALKRDSFIR